MEDSVLAVSMDWLVALLQDWRWLNPCFRAAAGTASFETEHSWNQRVKQAALEARTGH
jgi:hypothetical protein